MLTDPDASNSTSVPDPKKTTSLAIDLARQGDPVIIATLMNRLLERNGITVSAQRQGDCLQILLTGTAAPDRDQMLQFTQRGLTKLQPASITTVIVQGWQSDAQQPTWQEQFPLTSEPDPAPDIKTSKTQPEATLTVQDAPWEDQDAEIIRAQLLSPTVNPPSQSYKSRSPDFSSIGAIFAILVTIGFTGGLVWYLVAHLSSSSSRPGSPPSNTAPTSASDGGLKVIGFNWQIRYANPNLIGQLVNTSERQYAYVKIEFDLYDEAGQPVGDAMAIVTQVAPQSQREFEAPIVEPRAKKATVKAITAF